jgi:uncharacterized protein (DUF1697 family)
MARYVALLRGINVGGKNLIPMPALKACFEDGGFTDVRTYIQSGNVLFSAPTANAAQLTERTEQMIRTTFDHYDATVILRSKAQMRKVVDEAPPGFGSEPDAYRYDAIFLKAPLTAKAAIKEVEMKGGVDQCWAGHGVLYFSRTVERITSSRINRIVGRPVYQEMTIRNWNTTTKLAALLDETG